MSALMDVDSDDRGYTFEELDLIEAKMKREEEVEARRLAADDEWSDRVVAEQEQARARKAAEAAKRPAAATASAKEEERCHLAAALAPFGLIMAAVEGAGRGVAEFHDLAHSHNPLPHHLVLAVASVSRQVSHGPWRYAGPERVIASVLQ